MKKYWELAEDVQQARAERDEYERGMGLHQEALNRKGKRLDRIEDMYNDVVNRIRNVSEKSTLLPPDTEVLGYKPYKMPRMPRVDIQMHSLDSPAVMELHHVMIDFIEFELRDIEAERNEFHFICKVDSMYEVKKPVYYAITADAFHSVKKNIVDFAIRQIIPQLVEKLGEQYVVGL